MRKRAALAGMVLVIAGCHELVASRQNAWNFPAAPAPRPPASATARPPIVAARLSPEQVCATPGVRVGLAVHGARPYARSIAESRQPPKRASYQVCALGDGFCDTVDDAPPGASCFVANQNIARAEREARAAHSLPARASRSWDGRAELEHLERIDDHLHLNDRERELLQANGFVVLDRLEQDSYATAYHDIFQQQLPVFISIDSILHSVFEAQGALLERIELESLGPKLARALDRLHAALAASRHRFASEIAEDLDIYVSVARALLSGETRSLFGQDESVRALTATLAAADRGLVQLSLFGRERIVDSSQYLPRGRYAADGAAAMFRQFRHRGREIGLDSYFRAVTWLTRLELNLVSRPCPSSQPGASCVAEQTPHETRVALALAELCARTGLLSALSEIEAVYAAFAGARQDVSLAELAKTGRRAGTSSRDPNAVAKLERAFGNAPERLVRTHYMPRGAPALPVITSALGTRVTPDLGPLAALVHDALPGRTLLGAADLGYLLGHDRTLGVLASDFAIHPGLRAALDRGRSELAAGARSRRDPLAKWLGAILALSAPLDGVVPSFTRRQAYADLRLGSALVAYAQFRHVQVLMGGQGYDAYGCEIPDGYVEPALGVYDALLDWLRAARSLAPGSQPAMRRYFARAQAVLSMLRSIVLTQRSGAPLSEPEKRWLGMVAEYTPAGGWADSGAPPKYTGWYFDLFPDRELGAQKTGELVADYFTLTNADRVVYVGAERPRLGVFVVDTGGEPRAMVGPVAKGYELATSIAGRVGDAEARETPAKTGFWRSYVGPAPAAPPMQVEIVDCASLSQKRVVVTSTRALGPVTVRLLDHHGDALTESLTLAPAGAPAIFAFQLSTELMAKGVEGLHVHVHELAHAGVGQGRFDFTVGPGAFTTLDSPPERSLAVKSYTLGGFSP